MTRVLLARDVRAAAGGNALLSQAEQARAPEHVRVAAEVTRSEAAQGGGRGIVRTEALEAHLAARARELVGAVNQHSGVGRAFVSRAEVRAAQAQSPALGGRVQKAWEIVAGRAADVDGIAEAHARAFTADDGVFRTFTSEARAVGHQDPRGRSTTWLVKTAEEATKSTFVWGRNDLWSQRFDVDATSGVITVVAEH